MFANVDTLTSASTVREQEERSRRIHPRRNNPMKAKLSESDVTKQVVSFMEARGWRPIRMQVAMPTNAAGKRYRVGEPGMPDWLFVRYAFRFTAQVLWVEMKAQGKARSEAQLAWALKEGPRRPIVVVDNLSDFINWYQ